MSLRFMPPKTRLDKDSCASIDKLTDFYKIRPPGSRPPSFFLLPVPPLFLLPALALAYAALGWGIGLRFNRQILEHAWRVLPRVLIAIFALIVLGLLIAGSLMFFSGVAPLTAYLATSPGGADSVAVIAVGSAVDAGFVMAMQMVRFFMVLLLGPRLSRLLVQRLTSRSAA